MHEHRGWYSRDYLPHFDQPGLIQGITFRLVDSMPAEVVARWHEELRHLSESESTAEFQRRIADYLDACHGKCLLRNPRIAKSAEDALLHFDGERYRLLAWVVMPNHVHVLVETRESCSLAELLHSWKSFVAHQANQVLGRQGEFWQREYHDRYIRNAKHLAFARSYIAQNPVKARLCVNAEDWRWSSVWKGWEGEDRPASKEPHRE